MAAAIHRSMSALPGRPISAPDLQSHLLQHDARIRPRYVVHELVGEGGMAQVFRAEDREHGWPVALKVMRLYDNASSVRELALLEAHALSLAAQPGVVALHGYGETADGRPYLALEWLTGTTLLHALRVQGALPPSVVRDVMEELLAILAQVHERGVIHSDLKPENIVLEPRRGGAPRLTLIDFGVASLRDLPLDTSSAGTPGYIAPEVFRGEPPTPASDVYAAGALLFELLTGHPAFDEVSLGALFDHQLHAPPPRAHPYCPLVRASLDDVLARALAPDPLARYADATELADAMTAALGLPA